MPDNEINDVRNTRHQISAEHEHDVNKLVAHYQAFEKELKAAGRFRFAGDAAGSIVEHEPEEGHVSSR